MVFREFDDYKDKIIRIKIKKGLTNLGLSMLNLSKT